ncbi:Uncharacterised protein [Mycobacteroides abscessus subsp. abscessus]|nr:Uncharacterised protein [Mycobacteroides abscessus subsp. abscessus]
MSVTPAMANPSNSRPANAKRCAAETSTGRRCWRNRTRCMPTGATSSMVEAIEQLTVTRYTVRIG